MTKDETTKASKRKSFDSMLFQKPTELASGIIADGFRFTRTQENRVLFVPTCGVQSVAECFIELSQDDLAFFIEKLQEFLHDTLVHPDDAKVESPA